MVILPSFFILVTSNTIAFHVSQNQSQVPVWHSTTFYSSVFCFFCNFLLSHSSICQNFKKKFFLRFWLSVPLPSPLRSSSALISYSECNGHSFRCKRTFSSYDIPLLTPSFNSPDNQEHFLQQPENQWSQVHDKKIAVAVFIHTTNQNDCTVIFFLPALLYASPMV